MYESAPKGISDVRGTAEVPNDAFVNVEWIPAKFIYERNMLYSDSAPAVSALLWLCRSQSEAVGLGWSFSCTTELLVGGAVPGDGPWLKRLGHNLAPAELSGNLGIRYEYQYLVVRIFRTADILC
jgi:hypothetical protein